jgi:hypothetical protein
MPSLCFLLLLLLPLTTALINLQPLPFMLLLAKGLRVRRTLTKLDMQPLLLCPPPALHLEYAVQGVVIGFLLLTFQQAVDKLLRPRR